MNAFLAGIVGFLNGLLALLIILGVAVIGADQVGGGGVGLLLGLIFGVITAGVVCGLLAIFIEIRSELIKIRIALTERPLPATLK
jgi:hypothetical protein